MGEVRSKQTKTKLPVTFISGSRPELQPPSIIVPTSQVRTAMPFHMEISDDEFDDVFDRDISVPPSSQEDYHPHWTSSEDEDENEAEQLHGYFDP